MFEIIDIESLSMSLKENPRTFLIENLIANNSLNFITGPSTVGKTTVIYHLAKCIVDNDKWFDFQTKPGNVLIFDNEMGDYEAVAKLESLNTKNKRMIHYIKDQFIDVRDDRDKTLMFSFIQERVQKHNLKLIIIDSLSACCGNLDENNNSDMRTFMDFADKLSHICTTFVIHHKGKSFENEYRGASIIKDRADNFFVMDKPGEIKISKNRSSNLMNAKISFNYIQNDGLVSLVLDEANSDGFQPKKMMSEIILENLEDGMNQTQLFQKLRRNGIRFVNTDVRKILNSSTKIKIEKGPNNSSIYKHK